MLPLVGKERPSNIGRLQKSGWCQEIANRISYRYMCCHQGGRISAILNKGRRGPWVRIGRWPVPPRRGGAQGSTVWASM
ncbi:hypothetical protein CRG98_028234 [Punica granatum]|uniref:Uncharacterized protein n=1 Tax=Punica granatum TaxID=22663 RepID=A0A2I0J5N6_PUNGR|nr:hypothetical protein CRG98_028234 [Punica granatum]